LRHSFEELRELPISIRADYSSEHVPVDKMPSPARVFGLPGEDGPEFVSMRPQSVKDGFLELIPQSVENRIKEAQCDTVIRVPVVQSVAQFRAYCVMMTVKRT
jgi:hypothetical protein